MPSLVSAQTRKFLAPHRQAGPSCASTADALRCSIGVPGQASFRRPVLCTNFSELVSHSVELGPNQVEHRAQIGVLAEGQAPCEQRCLSSACEGIRQSSARSVNVRHSDVVSRPGFHGPCRVCLEGRSSSSATGGGRKASVKRQSVSRPPSPSRF